MHSPRAVYIELQQSAEFSAYVIFPRLYYGRRNFAARDTIQILGPRLLSDSRKRNSGLAYKSSFLSLRLDRITCDGTNVRIESFYSGVRIGENRVIKLRGLSIIVVCM